MRPPTRPAARTTRDVSARRRPRRIDVGVRHNKFPAKTDTTSQQETTAQRPAAAGSEAPAVSQPHSPGLFKGMTTSPKYQPSPPNRLCELNGRWATQCRMETLQNIAVLLRVAAPHTQQAHQQTSMPPQPQKSVQPPTLQTPHQVAPRGVKTPLQKTLFLTLTILTLAFSMHTTPISTTPITCTPHQSARHLTIPAPSPFIPSPQPHDWIGALHDTLQTRNQNQTAAGWQHGERRSKGSSAQAQAKRHQRRGHPAVHPASADTEDHAHQLYWPTPGTGSSGSATLRRMRAPDRWAWICRNAVFCTRVGHTGSVRRSSGSAIPQ